MAEKLQPCSRKPMRRGTLMQNNFLESKYTTFSIKILHPPHTQESSVYHRITAGWVWCSVRDDHATMCRRVSPSSSI